MNLKKLLLNQIDLIKSLFINGLVFILPLTITFTFINLIFNLIRNFLEPLKKIKIPFLKEIPHYEFILSIIIIFLTGFFLKIFILKPLIKLIENIFGKIPLISTIYFGIKQLIHSLTAQDKNSFKEVVIIEYPRKGIYSLGFLTNYTSDLIIKSDDKEIRFVTVYIPTTPNPAAGHFMITEESTIRRTNLTRQEAIGLIISGGIIQPERINCDSQFK